MEDRCAAAFVDEVGVVVVIVVVDLLVELIWCAEMGCDWK